MITEHKEAAAELTAQIMALFTRCETPADVTSFLKTLTKRRTKAAIEALAIDASVSLIECLNKLEADILASKTT